ncbi:antibiotic biosynthesis monooxygenase [Panacibacter ginsenosidivorans]|uniref:Antibiotic biosynthesis monooxygenase n=1 Tax=Panacibacter ginsenosidivorans TaxID=1813871 RepID=A0A5B8V6U7_9BACT|nr:antibiotic biosynthesis monooxygenase [Panacibacter ginsenosidivorans]QEC67207.1 antibiotic biosynthesis monooxygenase [Panacibacter ginsenosidivorans]
MITRIWHGRTLTKDAAEYRNFVIETGVRDYKSVPGNLGVQIWQREEGEVTHIYTVSWWDTYQSIKQFAGEDFEKAKYYEDDKKYLLEFEPHVMHCETFDFR